MRIFYLTFLCFGLLLFGGGIAHASSLKEIRVTLESGRYDMVVEQGSALGTADGLALAAEALNAKLLLGQTDTKTEKKSKTAKRAMRFAKAALEIDPKHADAQFQYALAYGFYGRHVSTFTAWRKKLPKKIAHEIDKAAAMAPDDFRTEALKGAWHLNLLYRADGFNVEKRFGANANKGRQHFESALKKSPNDIIMNTSYLMLNFVLDPEGQAVRTKSTLKSKILPLKPNNAVEKQILTQMQAVYNGFETGAAHDEALKQAEIFVNQ